MCCCTGHAPPESLLGHCRLWIIWKKRVTSAFSKQLIKNHQFIDHINLYYSSLPDSVVFGDLTVDVDLFWEKVAGSLKRNLDIKCKEKFKLGKTEPFEIPAMKTLEDIMNVFALEAEIWRYLFEEPDRKVVLFFDEFDTLLSPNQKQVCDSFLTNLRIIKTSPHYAIKSVVGIGTFSILNLNTSNRSVSPFNVSDAFKNPNFTEDEVKLIYDEFINEYGLEIDDLIIKDIYVQTNGYVKQVKLQLSKL